MTTDRTPGQSARGVPPELLAAAVAQPPNYRRLRDVGQRVLLVRLLSELGLYLNGRPKPGLSESADLTDAEVALLIDAPAIAPPDHLIALLQQLAAPAEIASFAAHWCCEYLGDIAREREDGEDTPGRLAWHLATEFAEARTATARLLTHLRNSDGGPALGDRLGLLPYEYAWLTADPGSLHPAVARTVADLILEDEEAWDALAADYCAVINGVETAITGVAITLPAALRYDQERQELEEAASRPRTLLTDAERQAVAVEAYKRVHLTPTARRGLADYARGVRSTLHKPVSLKDAMMEQLRLAVALAEADALRPGRIRLGTMWVKTKSGSLDDSCIAAETLPADQLYEFLVQRTVRHATDELTRGEPRMPADALDTRRSHNVEPSPDSVGVPGVQSIEGTGVAEARAAAGHERDAQTDFDRLITQTTLHELWPRLRPSEQRLIVAIKQDPSADDPTLADHLECSPDTIRSTRRHIRKRLGPAIAPKGTPPR